ncbi:hypothetical protein [Sedimenticola hydrogenitrophicus]|uniref:hypothetical protein n=1 Tax=Sedimenticola hydrogenitrophicus TaxID=2967975 RepID=UPI0023AFFF28|nr:hypothetical protein [Sedimenticola hydrogenitrophicus]
MVVGAVSRGQNALQSAMPGKPNTGKGDNDPKAEPRKAGDNNAHVDVAADRGAQRGGDKKKGDDKEGGKR